MQMLCSVRGPVKRRKDKSPPGRIYSWFGKGMVQSSKELFKQQEDSKQPDLKWDGDLTHICKDVEMASNARKDAPHAVAGGLELKP